MNSHSHPNEPPAQFIFSSLAATLLRRLGCVDVWRVGVPATSLMVVVTSDSFQHALVAAATEAAQQLSEEQADHDQDHGDRASRTHEVCHESLLVHLQR